jgi:hypothetical protein
MTLAPTFTRQRANLLLTGENATSTFFPLFRFLTAILSSSEPKPLLTNKGFG